jgi:GNAT superfamily N-acetyltransferase
MPASGSVSQQSPSEAGTIADFAAAYLPFVEELADLRPPDATVIDAHTHLGADEDGQTLSPEALIGFLDQAAPGARACAFAFHDPDRSPSYRRPNDRVLAWAADSGGRIVPYCRLDPADDPVGEARRCLARGARGIKLHPRAQAFGFGDAAAEAIFAVARDAGVPILVHAGRGMPRMDPLAELALRFPEVTLVLAHTALADQGMFAHRLADHPNVLYDTSCFAPLDVVELFARVPAERIVFASDVPYGRPVGGLYAAMRVAELAGLDASERALVAGGTMAAALDGRALAPTHSPRLDTVRPVNGTLQRAGTYLMMGFAAAVSGGERPDVSRSGPWIAHARSVCRDPDPGHAGPALARIDAALSAAERLLAQPPPVSLSAFGLLHGAAVIAVTEAVGSPSRRNASGSEASLTMPSAATS